MGYDYYFINETKKQIVHSKKLYAGFEAERALVVYLSFCKGDTIRIVGEENALVEKEVFGYGEKHYQYINLYEFKIPEDDRIDSPDVDRLREVITKEVSS